MLRVYPFGLLIPIAFTCSPVASGGLHFTSLNQFLDSQFRGFQLSGAGSCRSTRCIPDLIRLIEVSSGFMEISYPVVVSIPSSAAKNRPYADIDELKKC